MKNIVRYFSAVFLLVFLVIPAASYAADTTITIRAKSRTQVNVWPHMVLTVNGTAIKDWPVSSADYKDYTASASLKTGSNSFSIAFDNDGKINDQDRDLVVDYIKIGSTKIEAESSVVTYDRITKEDIPGQEIILSLAEITPCPGAAMSGFFAPSILGPRLLNEEILPAVLSLL